MTPTPRRSFPVVAPCFAAAARWRGLAASMLASALVAVLTSCGGGVDSGGTGSPTYASGPISGFGSVIVNGVRFDDSSATVEDADGTSRSRDDLRLGMTTEIRGSSVLTDNTGTRVSTASSIRFGSEIVGRLDSIDRVANRLVVLGQIVNTNPATVFDSTSLAGGQAALVVGDVLEVYALFDAATNQYTATRIERRGSATTFRLRGVVSLLDVQAKAFNIGSERISYAGVAAPVFTGLANGSVVTVRLQTTKTANGWLVTTLADTSPKPRDLDDVRLEGIVGAYTSAARFTVNGVAVDASRIAAVPGLVAGARVEVEGVSTGGVLIASQLKVKSAGEVAGSAFEVRGSIASVNAAQSSFVVRGVAVVYSASTEFRSGAAANLLVGANVEARGLLSSDGTRLVASRITFK